MILDTVILTVSMTVCDRIFVFVSPGRAPRGRRGRIPRAFRSFGAGLDQYAVSTPPSTPHCQRHPHPPRRTRPLPSPTPSTRRSTPGAAVRVRPPAVAQGCGLVGRRVGRRIQVQMQSVSRRPRQPTPCRRRRGSPRASSRSSLGPTLRVELRGSVACGPSPSALCLCGPAPEMNCTSYGRVRTF